MKDQLPHLKAIVQYKGQPQQRASYLYSVRPAARRHHRRLPTERTVALLQLLSVFLQWADFLKMGEDMTDQELNAVISSLRANECCTLIYTSGTTGNPKGVMLSHDNVSHRRTTFTTSLVCAEAKCLAVDSKPDVRSQRTA